MISLYYNDASTDDYKIKVKSRPKIPTSVHRYTEVSIPGRDGVLHKDEKSNEDIQIDVEFNFISENYMHILRRVKSWLIGTGKLSFSYDRDFFYKVKKITFDTAEVTVKKLVNFTAHFACEPYLYSEDGQQKLKNPTQLYNEGYEARPLYKIYGEGICELVVNGKTVKANVGQSMIIDVERELAYRDDGKIMNTYMSGNFEDLRLKNGNNIISITEGFTLEVTPNWRWY